MQQQLSGSVIPAKEQFWLTPPELLQALTAEFGQLYDPCPFPRPEGFDGLEVEWGSPAYCNPLFGKGTAPSRWTKKAIEQAAAGKTVLLILPCYFTSELQRAWKAGASFRPLGCVHWLSTTTGRPSGKQDLFMFLAVWSPPTPEVRP